ncbi:hypothetical protein QYF61_024612 [Mycteria americana]|uniref:Uncharacterized protein n=1 Tax=Mycteria americana TaxID=33587 RepID=A0AAN7NXS2_MYCAM|nr:hypothetical protein QYF61_024612 [Mycteria americana]
MVEQISTLQPVEETMVEQIRFFAIRQVMLIKAALGSTVFSLVPTIQEIHGQTGEGPKEGHRDDQRPGESVYEERLKELGLFSLEKAQGVPHHSIPVLKGQLQRGQRLSLHKEPHGEDRGQWGKHSQLPQPLLMREMLQSLKHLCGHLMDSPVASYLSFTGKPRTEHRTPGHNRNPPNKEAVEVICLTCRSSAR